MDDEIELLEKDRFRINKRFRIKNKDYNRDGKEELSLGKGYKRHETVRAGPTRG